jgi:hypothetical protein
MSQAYLSVNSYFLEHCHSKTISDEKKVKDLCFKKVDFIL